MAVLEHLEPKGVFRFFEELCAIPHGSSNTKQISDWLMTFAWERNLEAYQDELNNVIIIKEATPGYENAAPVILQGHTDMVCEKTADCPKDMEREGLDLAVEGDTIYAINTTLGGDDGIAVALALAVLDAQDLQHPRVETVFTVDEEIGMLGAAGLNVSCLKGRRLLNIDTEKEGIFTVSCAGGVVTQCVLPLKRAAFEGVGMKVTVGGLAGGHSGIEIDKERGNSNLLMGRVLYAAAQKVNLRLVDVNGGLKDNAIPRETVATVVTADPEALKVLCGEMNAVLKNEYRITDPDVFVSVSETDAGLPMDEATTRKAICFLTTVPNGVQTMSAEIPGLVQTSMNLGVLKTSEIELYGASCVRSSVETQKQMLVERIRCLGEMLGAEVTTQGDYAGWEYRPDSPLRNLLAEVFEEQNGYQPKIEAFHAGLECGVLISKLPGLDCVSIGPDLEEIHTVKERLYIGSTQRLWNLVTETLKRMK